MKLTAAILFKRQQLALNLLGGGCASLFHPATTLTSCAGFSSCPACRPIFHGAARFGSVVMLDDGGTGRCDAPDWKSGNVKTDTAGAGSTPAAAFSKIAFSHLLKGMPCQKQRQNQISLRTNNLKTCFGISTICARVAKRTCSALADISKKCFQKCLPAMFMSIARPTVLDKSCFIGWQSASRVNALGRFGSGGVDEHASFGRLAPLYARRCATNRMKAGKGQHLIAAKAPGRYRRGNREGLNVKPIVGAGSTRPAAFTPTDRLRPVARRCFPHRCAFN